MIYLDLYLVVQSGQNLPILTSSVNPQRSTIVGNLPSTIKDDKLPFHSFLNGALHWLTFTQDSPDFIRCFDFGSEQFRVVLEPPECGLPRKNFMGFVRVGVLRDSRYISDFSNPFHWDIWIMKDYGIKESWSKQFVIGNVTSKRGYGDYYETIMILKNGEILMLVNKGVLVLYSPKEGRVEKLNIDGININPAFYGIAHIPSFVSLKDVAKENA
ncbi:F-box protein At3g07870-like [Camellia sinensis]|uniref:F-box protein At3g07870-like n=1 Tax=Camellia sinensis TaxID=4442 RepID=UPI001036854A|nr:F-box protein At3g07870-like [Camellia sinensis]